MHNLLFVITAIYPKVHYYNLIMLVFRTTISLQLIFTHRLMKLGVNEIFYKEIAYSFNWTALLNVGLAITANLICPLFIMVGFLTRLAVMPILIITLSSCFFIHGDDSVIEKELPFMYSLPLLLLLFTGAGRYSFDNYIHQSYKLRW